MGEKEFTKDKTIEYAEKYRKCTNALQDLMDLMQIGAFALGELEEWASMPMCKTCQRQGCEYKPKLGEMERLNCPLWKGSAV